MSIKDNIIALRTKYGMSQKDLAKIAGVSDKAVSSWENGTREPRMGVIQKIADHFGITKSDIIEDENLDKTPTYLSIPESTLIKKYRTLEEDGKERMHRYADMEMQILEEKKAKEQKEKEKQFSEAM